MTNIQKHTDSFDLETDKVLKCNWCNNEFHIEIPPDISSIIKCPFCSAEFKLTPQGRGYTIDGRFIC